jgi:hypothetical protein
MNNDYFQQLFSYKQIYFAGRAACLLLVDRSKFAIQAMATPSLILK